MLGTHACLVPFRSTRASSSTRQSPSSRGSSTRWAPRSLSLHSLAHYPTPLTPLTRSLAHYPTPLTPLTPLTRSLSHSTHSTHPTHPTHPTHFTHVDQVYTSLNREGWCSVPLADAAVIRLQLVSKQNPQPAVKPSEVPVPLTNLDAIPRGRLDWTLVRQFRQYFGPFFRVSKLYATPTLPWVTLCLAPVLGICGLVLVIRCRGQSTSEGRDPAAHQRGQLRQEDRGQRRRCARPRPQGIPDVGLSLTASPGGTARRDHPHASTRARIKPTTTKNQAIKQSNKSTQSNKQSKHNHTI